MSCKAKYFWFMFIYCSKKLGVVFRIYLSILYQIYSRTIIFVINMQQQHYHIKYEWFFYVKNGTRIITLSSTYMIKEK